MNSGIFFKVAIAYCFPQTATSKDSDDNFEKFTEDGLNVVQKENDDEIINELPNFTTEKSKEKADEEKSKAMVSGIFITASVNSHIKLCLFSQWQYMFFPRLG